MAVDLAIWFSGNEANIAAMLEGESEVPVPNDYYIRNEDPTVVTMPVHEEVEVTSVWYDYDTDPDFENDPLGYADFLTAIQSNEQRPRGQLRHSPWWATVEDGTVVALDEQYVP